MDFAAVAQDEIAKLNESGEIEARIREKARDAVFRQIDESFRSFGSVSKQVEQVIKERLVIDPSRVDLSAYNKTIENVICAAVAEFAEGQARKAFEELLAERLAPAPKSISVREIVEMYVEEWRDQWSDSSEEYASIELKRWGNSSLNVTVTDGSKFGEKVCFTVDTEKSRISVIHSIPARTLGTCSFGADARLYQMYAAGTEVTGAEDFHEDDADLSLSPHH